MDYGYEIDILRTSSSTFINYCYIVTDLTSKKAIIVDPAWELEKIVNRIKELGVHLKAVLLTHSHYDHVHLANPLVEIYGCSVYMSKIEIDYYQFSCNNLNGLMHLDQIDIGKLQITCLTTPGHTAGGMCYYLPSSLFTGDTIFTEGCGACYFDGASAEQMYRSVQFIKKSLSNSTHIYPGHSYGRSPGYTIKELMKYNIYFQIDEEKQFVSFRMRGNQKRLLDFK
ncbi:MBL fold metallo-hydrolase [Saccharibacillus brassicae]|uniref:MBL fold metallo-hydrolase n=1 Tax=Saccharibacillus brassicae TaxID=2583377 RepID=A0A4Y6V0Q6_SACBS|nr:MBL fold metallo-hydrolase [Saccharibacillus brassicae]QDH23619.1 MBL fold metallo-hydrolase [Saccharibacillus brassicae]